MSKRRTAAPTPHLDRFLAERVSPEVIAEEFWQETSDSPAELAWKELRERFLEREGQQAVAIAELIQSVDGMWCYEEGIRNAAFVMGFECARHLLVGERKDGAK